MDRYEYKLKAEELQKLVRSRRYEAALAIAEEMDFRKERDVRLLQDAAETYAALYRKVGYPVFSVSSLSGEGIDELKADLTAQLASGGTAAFAGASTVSQIFIS